jgi:hypothetical protein
LASALMAPRAASQRSSPMRRPCQPACLKGHQRPPLGLGGALDAVTEKKKGAAKRPRLAVSVKEYAGSCQFGELRPAEASTCGAVNVRLHQPR